MSVEASRAFANNFRKKAPGQNWENCSMSLISSNFDVKSIFFPNFDHGPYPEIAGKSPVFGSQDTVLKRVAQIKMQTPSSPCIGSSYTRCWPLWFLFY